MKTNARKGFTLVEMLAVMMIMSMMLGIGLPVVLSLQTQSEAEMAAQTLVSSCELARRTAIAHQVKVMVEIQNTETQLGASRVQGDMSVATRASVVPTSRVRVIKYRYVPNLIREASAVRQLDVQTAAATGATLDYSRTGLHFALDFREPLFEKVLGSYVQFLAVNTSASATPGLDFSHAGLPVGNAPAQGIEVEALQSARIYDDADENGTYIYPNLDTALPQLYYDSITDNIYYRVWSSAGRKLERDWRCWIDFFPDGNWRVMRQYNSGTPVDSTWNGFPLDTYDDIDAKLVLAYIPPSKSAAECEYFLLTISPRDGKAHMENVKQQ